jgi:hypothetical protein
MNYLKPIVISMGLRLESLQQILLEKQLRMKTVIKKIGCFIRLGSILEHIIGLVTLGHGKTAASWVARKLGYSNCGCDRRRVTMNQWTCPDYSETISIL